MTKVNNTALPEGWQWATNPFDIRKGISVSKIWWANNKPMARCQVFTEVDRSGNRRAVAALSVAKTVYKPTRRNEPPNLGWAWEFIMELPSVAPDPLAAATMVEMDWPDIERSVRQVYSRSGARPWWEI